MLLTMRSRVDEPSSYSGAVLGCGESSHCNVVLANGTQCAPATYGGGSFVAPSGNTATSPRRAYSSAGSIPGTNTPLDVGGLGGLSDGRDHRGPEQGSIQTNNYDTVSPSLTV